jgi:hypothetical protein
MTFEARHAPVSSTSRRKGIVPEYLLHAFCPLCHGFHDTAVRVECSESFDIASLDTIYGSDQLPISVAMALAQQFLCPKTGEWFTQSDPRRLFLITPDASPENEKDELMH